MELNIKMSHVSLFRIFDVYTKILPSLIEEDKAKAISAHYNTLRHLYDSSPAELQEAIQRRNPEIYEYIR